MLNPDVVDVILAKKKNENTSKNTKKQQPTENQTNPNIKMSAKEGEVFTFSLSGGSTRPPAPRQLRHYSQTVEEAIRHLHKQERKRSTPVRRRFSRAQAILGRITPTGWVPVSGMNASFTNTYCNKALWTSLIRKTAKCRTHDRLFRFG